MGRAFAIGVALNTAFVAVEVVVGFLSHSMALLADAGRLLTFKQAAEDYLAAHEKGWRNRKHRAAWSHTCLLYTSDAADE